LTFTDYQNRCLEKIEKKFSKKDNIAAFVMESGAQVAGGVIIYPKGCWHALSDYSKIGASAIGLDWTCSARNARYLTQNNVTLQGNFDPSRLFSSKKTIISQTKQMLNDFGKDKYIVNLGHGILPNTPVENVQAFVETIKNFN
jgi:uroporphyrinogen decarboxylase